MILICLLDMMLQLCLVMILEIMLGQKFAQYMVFNLGNVHL